MSTYIYKQGTCLSEGLAETNNRRDLHHHTGLCRTASVWGHCASSTHTHKTDLSSRGVGGGDNVHTHTQTHSHAGSSSSAVNRRTRSYKHTLSHFCRTTALTDDDRVYIVRV